MLDVLLLEDELALIELLATEETVADCVLELSFDALKELADIGFSDTRLWLLALKLVELATLIEFEELIEVVELAKPTELVELTEFAELVDIMLELCMELELDWGVGELAELPDDPPHETRRNPKLDASKKEYFITISRLWLLSPTSITGH